MDKRQNAGEQIRREYSRAPHQETTEEIERDISRTRAEMTETVEAIQDKLSPVHLKEQVRDKMRGAITGRAKKMMKETTQRTKEAGSSLIDAIKRHPIPTVMLGAGTAWLIVRGMRGNGYRGGRIPSSEEIKGKTEDVAGYARQKSEEIKIRVQERAGQAKARAGEMTEMARERTRRAASRIRETVNSSPFTIGAAAFALGAAIGLMIPETRREKELAGEARYAAIEKAREAAAHAMDRAKQAVESATEKVVETLKEEVIK